MFKFFSLFLVGLLVREGYATLAPYSRPCALGDSECYIITNTRHALSQLGAGLPQYGINSIDPLVFTNVTLSQGVFKLVFPYMKVVGSTGCTVEDMKLNFAQSTMSLTLDCPVKIIGKYKFNGNIYFYEASHEGNYIIRSDKMRTTIDFKIDTIRGADGKRYWKLDVLEYVYEPQETLRIQLDHLFSGEVTKEAPYFSPASGEWWPTVAKTAEPVVSATVSGLHSFLQAFFEHVPLDQLSTQILPRPTYKLDPSIENSDCFSISSVTDLV